MEYHWLHISDLHFHDTSYESVRMREELLKKIKIFSKNQPFDFVFCTGDLADKNGKCQDELLKFLVEIVEAANVNNKHIYIVPGNHDHDRNANAEILEQIYEPYDIKDGEINESKVNKNIEIFGKQFDLKRFNTYFEILDGLKEKKDEDGSHSVSVNDNASKIVKVNTALFERDSTLEHQLHIGVLELLQTIKDSGVDETTFNIAIGHHPTECFAPEEKQRFLDCLSSNSIHFYLCGHNHRPEFIYHNNFDVVEVVCGQVRSDDYYNGGFSIGTIDEDKNKCHVVFYKWQKGSDWVRDTSVNGCDEGGFCYINGKRYKNKKKKKIIIPFNNSKRIDIGEIDFNIEECEILWDYKQDYSVESINWETELPKTRLLAEYIKSVCDNNLYILPLAPIPLLISLGYYLQRENQLEILQFDRDHGVWIGQRNTECPEYKIKKPKKRLFQKHKSLTIIIETSTEIDKKQVICKGSDVAKLVMKDKKLGYPLYSNHYENMLNDFFDKINPMVSAYDEINLYASIPAGMAIELGRNIQKGVYPKTNLYNFKNNKYTYVTTLNVK